MYKNTREVLSAFERSSQKYLGRANASISTDGCTIWSYGTALLTYDGKSDRYVFNSTHYSKTTSSQQNALRSWLPLIANVDERLVVVDGIDRGATSDTLLRAAAE